MVIKALKSFKKESIYYILCGTGQKEQGYKKLAKKTGLENHVIFAGQRDHEWVMKLAHAVDLGAIPSKIEGLGLNAFSGIPNSPSISFLSTFNE